MTKNSTTSSKEESLHGWLIYKFFPFWPIFAGLLTVGVLGAWIYLQYKSPVYQASATLIIKDEKKGVDDSQIMEAMNPFASNKIVENEIEVIQSRKIMTQVVKNLNLYAPIFEDGNLNSFSEFVTSPFSSMKKISAYTTSPVVVEFKNIDKFTSSSDEPSNYYFSYDTSTGTVTIDGTSFPLNQWVKIEKFGEIKFKKNFNQTGIAKNQLYFTLINPKAITNSLLNKLTVSSGDKLSTVVNLVFQDSDQRRGEDILNNLILTYNQAAIVERNALASNTLSFIEDRMKNVESDLVRLETEIQQFRSIQGVIDLSEQGKLYLKDVGDNGRMIADLELQLAVLENIENYVVSKGNSGGIVPSTIGINDPVLTQLLQRLYDSEIKYEKLSRTTAENNPILVAVTNEIEKIRPSILENVHSQQANLKSRLKSLNNTNRDFTSTLKTIPEKERALLEISRRKAIKSELFSFLLQQREATALSYAPTDGDSRIVDMAESSLEPVSPKPMMIYAIGIVLALGAGIGFVTLREMSNKILYGYELEKFTYIPVIGELPFRKEGRKNAEAALLDRFITERFRDLRIALGLFGKTGNKRKILVTSSIEGEGKSFISENLGLNLAISGKKVVVLNFDLRKPNSSLFSSVSEEAGIGDYLTKGIDPKKLIHSTNFNNLYMIPAGNVEEDNSRLILDAELKPLFDYLENSFDYIIVDTPPVGTALDACILSKFCNLTLFVARHAHTPKWIIKHLDQNKNINQLSNVFIVFNGVKKRGVYEKGYGYGYGYGFNYGYKAAPIIQHVL